ncbi:MAG: tripartite tricarboxylate transporter permease [Xanthobacteraceae bacterium]
METITGEIAFMAAAAGKAFMIIIDPTRLMYMVAGCLMGLVLGIVPGIGGIAGTAMLLPFTFNMDPYTAFALLLGLLSTVATGDPIPAVLFGVPGGAGSAATVLDGFPMAKRGEAGRALSAAYMSSMMGGVFGAMLVAIAIPILRPVMLFLGSPELLAFAVLGISMVAVLSGNAPLRGIAVGCLGIMCAMIGTDPQSGTLRWTFNSLYLWDGLPLVPALLGLFALPELCDLLITRTAIAANAPITKDIYKGQWQGVKDCWQNWWLIVRCSWIGGGIGSIPGIGSSVLDWLAYGHALKTEKGAALTFGKGDVRGLIASESANNANRGGDLVPTVAFGVPAGAAMAILLGAFLIHGLVPGPDMLTKNLDVTYSLIWTVALANILGAGLCYLFSPQFARLATLRFSLILPAVLGVIYIGAFEATRQWGDLYALLLFGLLGWLMKQAKWPRPPLVLGLVLGDTIERYMFISVERYGVSWFARPVVAVLFLMAFLGLIRPLLDDVRRHGGILRMMTDFGGPRLHPVQLMGILMLFLFGSAMLMAVEWDFSAKVVPLVVGTVGFTAAALGLLNDMCRREKLAPVALEPQVAPAADGGLRAEPAIGAVTPGGMALAMESAGSGPSAAAAPAEQSLASIQQASQRERMHMDLESDTMHLPVRTIALRAARFFAYLIGFMGVMAIIGLVPTVGLFVIFFMRYENQERWTVVLPYAITLMFAISFVFDYIMSIPWPPTLIAQWFPALKMLPSI